MVGENYVWYIVLFVIFMGFEGAKEEGGCFEVIIWGGNASNRACGGKQLARPKVQVKVSKVY